MVGDSNTADDLFQEAAVIMLQKREQVGADGNFLAWGRAIAFNVVRDYRKKRARQKVHALDDHALQFVAEAFEDFKVASNCSNSPATFQKSESHRARSLRYHGFGLTST